MKAFKAFRAAAVLTAICALRFAVNDAQAQLFNPALQFTGGIPNSTGTTSTRGYSFDVTAAAGVLVTGLSIYDEGANGLSDSHDVGLWDSAGNLLASLTIPAGTTAPLDSSGIFRYEPLTIPVLLAAGTNYAVGAVFLDGTSDFQVFGFTNITTAPGITYDEGRYINNGSSTLSFPTSVFSGGLPGGSFEIATVPEPSTWSMLLGGVGVLGCAQCLRRRNV